jgi:hypothetical protein
VKRLTGKEEYDKKEGKEREIKDRNIRNIEFERMKWRNEWERNVQSSEAANVIALLTGPPERAAHCRRTQV